MVDVFDVYIQQSNNKVYLVDFNPFSPTTDALLYNWNELMACKSVWCVCAVDTVQTHCRQ